MRQYLFGVGSMAQQMHRSAPADIIPIGLQALPLGAFAQHHIRNIVPENPEHFCLQDQVFVPFLMPKPSDRKDQLVAGRDPESLKCTLTRDLLISLPGFDAVGNDRHWLPESSPFPHRHNVSRKSLYRPISVSKLFRMYQSVSRSSKLMT